MSLTLAGVPYEIPGLDVVPGPDLGLTWRVGEARVAKRTTQPRIGVIHATGGDGDASRVFRTLSMRGYSVEFCLESSGRIIQYLDPMFFSAAHTGGMNARAIGIEVVNPMYPALRPSRRAVAEGIVQVCGVIPADYPDDFILRRGRKLYYHRSNRKLCLGLTPKQATALRLFVWAISERTDIPPVRASARDYVPKAERAALRGWLGHSQVTLGHGDPSMDSLDLF